jgi:hypothetical protein
MYQLQMTDTLGFESSNWPLARGRLPRSTGKSTASTPFPPLVTIRVISETCTRWPIAERGAVGAESRYNSGHGEKVVVAQPVSQSAASVGSRFLAQDFGRSQDEPAGIFWSYQLKQLGYVR